MQFKSVLEGFMVQRKFANAVVWTLRPENKLNVWCVCNCY